MIIVRIGNGNALEGIGDFLIKGVICSVGKTTNFEEGGIEERMEMPSMIGLMSSSKRPNDLIKGPFVFVRRT